jgi:uncharacterized protein (TIGR02391 family)
MAILGMPGTRKVTVVRGDGTDEVTRFEVKSNVQGKKAYFDLNSGIETGDIVEYVDGRGVAVRRVIGDLDIRDVGSSLDHIEAALVDSVPPRRPPIRRLTFEALHPEVLSSAGALFADEHYSQAIFESLKALEARVRRQSGLSGSGEALMMIAFDPRGPLIDLSYEEGQSGEDEQRGLRFVFAGVMTGIRNPKGHSLVDQDDPQRALEYLAMVSVLFHRLDDAEAKANF